MGVHSAGELYRHVGHDVEVTYYGDADAPANVAIECMDCHEVLVDFDAAEEQDDAQA